MRQETEGVLQKVCNIYDTDGLLVEQYKTRVYTFPVGVFSSFDGRPSVAAPALYRAFTYDDEGNAIASIPEIREWDQVCEDAAQGSIPGDTDPGGVPAGLKVSQSTYEYNESLAVSAGATATLATKTLLAGEEIYLRHVPFGGENRGKFQVLVNGSVLQTKRTWWTRWDGDFWFHTANGGILLDNEAVIEVKVTNNGNTPCNYETAIGFVQKTTGA
jgi:hypothetical protein